MFTRRGVALALIAACTLVAAGCGSDEDAAATAPQTAPSADAVTHTYAIEGMHCDGCAQLIQAALADTEGVQDAAVSFDTKQAVVQCAPTVTDEQIIAAITATGYTAKAADPTP